MQDISRGEGRTVLFVSHNMAAVKSLCTRGIVLEHGTVKLISNIENAVSYYLSGDSEVINQKEFGVGYEISEFKLEKISINCLGKSSDEPLLEDSVIELKTVLTLKDTHLRDYHVTYHLYNEMGEVLFRFQMFTKKRN